MRYILIALLLWASPCLAWTIDTARGTQEVLEGDVLGQNSYGKTPFSDLNDVTFYKWNFSQEEPETDIFTNCTNITLIGCNLVNVHLPDGKGFEVIDCLTIQKNEKKYKDFDSDMKNIIKSAYGKTPTDDEVFNITIDEDDNMTTYQIDEEEFDIVERDFAHLSELGRQKIKDNYTEQGIPVMRKKEETFVKLKREIAPNDKKYKVKDKRKYTATRMFTPN